MSEVFERIVCGVDQTEMGSVAARIASWLTPPDGSLRLVWVDDSSLAVRAGFRVAAVAAGIHHEPAASDERRHDTDSSHAVTAHALERSPLDRLLSELERDEATLAVVGSHGRSRAVGIALGSIATHLVHEAPCSVLVARGPRDGESWPRSLVVGIDGSPESAAAAEVARGLAARFDAAVHFVAATADPVDIEVAREVAPDLQELPGRAVDELHDLSELADLVVVGSRGLKGIRALGSVSERIAHEALCSVLVVRQGPATRS